MQIIVVVVVVVVIVVVVVVVGRGVQRGPHPSQLWGGPGLLGARSPWPKDKNVQKKELQRAKQLHEKKF